MTSHDIIDIIKRHGAVTAAGVDDIIGYYEEGSGKGFSVTDWVELKKTIKGVGSSARLRQLRQKYQRIYDLPVDTKEQKKFPSPDELAAELNKLDIKTILPADRIDIPEPVDLEEAVDKDWLEPDLVDAIMLMKLERVEQILVHEIGVPLSELNQEELDMIAEDLNTLFPNVWRYPESSTDAVFRPNYMQSEVDGYLLALTQPRIMKRSFARYSTKFVDAAVQSAKFMMDEFDNIDADYVLSNGTVTGQLGRVRKVFDIRDASKEFSGDFAGYLKFYKASCGFASSDFHFDAEESLFEASARGADMQPPHHLFQVNGKSDAGFGFYNSKDPKKKTRNDRVIYMELLLADLALQDSQNLDTTKWDWIHLAKLKPKHEVIEREKHNEASRNILVYNAGFSRAAQAVFRSAVQSNYLDSRKKANISLKGFTPFYGGMNNLVLKLKHAVETNGRQVLVYADNYFYFDNKAAISMDGSKFESQQNKASVLAAISAVCESSNLPNVDLLLRAARQEANGNGKLNVYGKVRSNKKTNMWLDYMAHYADTTLHTVAVLGDQQIPYDGILGSGKTGTFDFNQARMCQVAYMHKQLNYIPPVTGNAEKGYRFTDQFQGLLDRSTTQLKIESVTTPPWGDKYTEIDMLGFDCLPITLRVRSDESDSEREDDNDEGFVDKRYYIGVLQYKRLLKMIAYDKTSVGKGVPIAHRQVYRFMKMKVALMVGGFAHKELARYLTNVLLLISVRITRDFDKNIIEDIVEQVGIEALEEHLDSREHSLVLSALASPTVPSMRDILAFHLGSDVADSVYFPEDSDDSDLSQLLYALDTDTLSSEGSVVRMDPQEEEAKLRERENDLKYDNLVIERETIKPIATKVESDLHVMEQPEKKQRRTDAAYSNKGMGKQNSQEKYKAMTDQQKLTEEMLVLDLIVKLRQNKELQFVNVGRSVKRKDGDLAAVISKILSVNFFNALNAIKSAKVKVRLGRGKLAQNVLSLMHRAKDVLPDEVNLDRRFLSLIRHYKKLDPKSWADVADATEALEDVGRAIKAAKTLKKNPGKVVKHLEKASKPEL